MALALGCTVTELQTKMSMSEFHLWLAYRKKYGPMNPVRLHDAGPALIASMISNANGGKARPIDFMPYAKASDEEEISNDQFVERLSAMKNVKVAR